MITLTLSESYQRSIPTRLFVSLRNESFLIARLRNPSGKPSKSEEFSFDLDVHPIFLGYQA